MTGFAPSAEENQHTLAAKRKKKLWRNLFLFNLCVSILLIGIFWLPLKLATITNFMNSASVNVPKETDAAEAKNSMVEEAPVHNSLLMQPMGALINASSDKDWAYFLASNEGTDTDAAIKAMIKQHEGLQLKQYNDQLGHATIGYGHRLTTDDDATEMTEKEANELFDHDYKIHKEAAKEVPGYANANVAQQAALIDLTFNMGKTWWKNFPKFTEAFKSGNYEAAAEQLKNSDWYKQVGSRARTVVKMIKELE